jgi:hypothetical protein
MAIRLPLTTVLDLSNTGEVGAGSVAGIVAKTFLLPQDTDNVVVKFTASTVGGGVSATLQTSDDAGTTWYECARTSIVSNANADTAQWLSVPVVGYGIATGVNVSSSIISVGIGSAASTLGSRQVSGLPILGRHNRIAIRLTGDLTANAATRTQVLVNNQSATA